MTRADDRIGQVRLSSGRMLSYASFGAVDGPTVVVLDGDGTRTQARDAHDIAQRRHVRLIAPDRPGFGHSTPDRDGTLLSFADDLAQLLSTLLPGSSGRARGG